MKIVEAWLNIPQKDLSRRLMDIPMEATVLGIRIGDNLYVPWANVLSFVAEPLPVLEETTDEPDKPTTPRPRRTRKKARSSK